MQPSELHVAAAGIRSIVWCIGFAADHRWVHAPVFDGRGRLCHIRGQSPVPGLYALGLPWLYTWGSGRFSGVARDAEHLAGLIEARRGGGSGGMAGSPRRSRRAVARVT